MLPPRLSSPGRKLALPISLGFYRCHQGHQRSLGLHVGGIQQALRLYMLEKASGCFIAMRNVPYPPIECPQGRGWPFRDRAIVAVDIGYQFLRYERFQSPWLRNWNTCSLKGGEGAGTTRIISRAPAQKLFRRDRYIASSAGMVHESFVHKSCKK